MTTFAGNVSSFSISAQDYLPGPYNITVDAVDIYGQSANVTVPLFLSGITEYWQCVVLTKIVIDHPLYNTEQYHRTQAIWNLHPWSRHHHTQGFLQHQFGSNSSSPIVHLFL